MGRIVVGVDGSEAAIAALRWAAAEAHLRKASLEIVASWHVPAYSELPGVISPDLIREMQEDAHQIADAAAKDATAETGVEVRTRVVEGPAAGRLIEAAEGADLLVVGSRGRGGFAGLLLGSVSHQVVTHARGPVVVVPYRG